MPDKKEKKIIFLAEDDEYISRAYKDGLERAGFEVIAASNGAEAIEMLKKVKPDLILLDIIMPKKDGVDVLREIKYKKKHAKTPIIVISNITEAIDYVKAKEFEGVEYLVKANYTIKEMVEKINKRLEKK